MTEFEELNYLKMFLLDISKNYMNEEEGFPINYESTCQTDDSWDYTILKTMEIPIVHTFDTISIESGDVIVRHIGIEAKNLHDVCKTSCGYNPVEIELKEPETFSLTSFKHSSYFETMLKQIGKDYSTILTIGKKLFEEYQENLLTPSEDTFIITKTFNTSEGYVRVDVDFFKNEISIDSNEFSTHGKTDMNCIEIVDREDYQNLEKSIETLNRILKIIEEGKSIQKIENGYIIGNKYYENLDGILEEGEG